MDYGTISQLIGSLGFPIVMCGVLVWMNYSQVKAHKESEENFTNALADNTKAYMELKNAISKLSEKEDN